MTSFLRRAILPLSLAAFAVSAAPSFLTTPFISQTAAHLTWGYQLDRLAMPVAFAVLVTAVLLTVGSWRTSRRRLGRAVLVLAVLLAGTAVLISSKNIAELAFNPLAQSRYVQIDDADHLDANDLVLGVHVDDQALIYPVGIIGYHHILNERLTGEPFVVTY